jgi:hypothetical protein
MLSAWSIRMRWLNCAQLGCRMTLGSKPDGARQSRSLHSYVAWPGALARMAEYTSFLDMIVSPTRWDRLQARVSLVDQCVPSPALRACHAKVRSDKTISRSKAAAARLLHFHPPLLHTNTRLSS